MGNVSIFNLLVVSDGSQKKKLTTQTWLNTDTDSLTYEIKAEVVYQDFSSYKDKFDSSDCPENSRCFDKSNKKVIEKLKDEASGIPLNEFITLTSKTYSYIKDTDESGKQRKA